MGCGDVCGRNGDSLVAYQLETPIPFGFQCDAVMGNGTRGVCGDYGYLSIRDSRYATVYIFSILTGLEPEQVIYAACYRHHRGYWKR